MTAWKLAPRLARIQDGGSFDKRKLCGKQFRNLSEFPVSNVWHIKLDDKGKQGLLSWAALVESKLISSFKLCLNQTKAQHVLVKCDNN